jgi:glutamate formiminotransferase/formiminotetrahydrofolate cyclodeaminase
VAKKVAKAIRYSSGGFRYIKAMGVPLASRNLAQVSMNLTDFEQTPLHRVFECVRSEAARHGVNIAGSEIVGLIPKKALEMTADFYLQFENFQPSVVLENRVEEALAVRGGLGEFLDALASPTPTPGGGSAAAAAGAMGAALGAMVARLAKQDPARYEQDRAFFTEAVTRDAASYDAVVTAYRMAKDNPDRPAAIAAALRGATLVPMEVAERAHALGGQLAALGASSPAKFGSDVETAAGLAKAALTGAGANVRINLDCIKEEEFKAEISRRMAALS